VTVSLAASVLLTAVFVACAWRIGVWPPRWDPAIARQLVVFSAPLIAFTVSQYVIRSVDLIAIRAYGTLHAVGVYAVAYRGYTVLQGMAAASGPVLTPLFVSLRMADREGAIRIYVERVLQQLLFIGSVLTGLAAPVVALAVPIVFGKEFEGATDPLLVLLVANCLFFTANLVASVLVLHSRTRTIAIVNVAAAVINVGLDLLLIGVLGVGIIGAAIATLAALVLVCWSYVAVAMRCVGSTARVSPALVTPMLIGTAVSLLLHDLGGAALAIVGTGLAAVVVQRIAHPFRVEDAGLVEKLDMPAYLKRLVLRGLKFAAR
jgi:O-antigen/teichoic acid export membrane protein